RRSSDLADETLTCGNLVSLRQNFRLDDAVDGQREAGHAGRNDGPFDRRGARLAAHALTGLVGEAGDHRPQNRHLCHDLSSFQIAKIWAAAGYPISTKNPNAMMICVIRISSSAASASARASAS